MATVHSPAVDSHLVVGSHLAAHIVVVPRQVCPVVGSHLAAHMVQQVCPAVVEEHSHHTDWVGWGLAPG